MKTYPVMLTIALTLWTAASALGQEDKSARESKTPIPPAVVRFGVPLIERVYETAMESPIDGIVNSALANAASMSMTLPNEDLDDLKDKVQSLAVSGRTPEIRYRASLASIVMSAPQLFANENAMQAGDESRFFASISATLEHSLFGARANNY